MNQYGNHVAREGTNRNNETRVIGLEMRLRRTPYDNFEEMEIFPCQYTMEISYEFRPEIQITVHTARGDMTLQGTLP